MITLIAGSVGYSSHTIPLFFINQPIKFPHAHRAQAVLLVDLSAPLCFVMMEKGSNTTTTTAAVVVGAVRSPMQLMMGPAATGDEEVLAQGNSNTTTTTTLLRSVDTFLRLLPIGLCVSALLLLLKNSQQNQYGSVSYTDLGAFRYLVHANGICAGYSLLSAVIAAMPRPSTSAPRAWTFFLLDQVLTYIILGAGAVSTEVLYLAENGDSAATWSSACGSFGQFCHKVTASINSYHICSSGLLCAAFPHFLLQAFQQL